MMLFSAETSARFTAPSKRSLVFILLKSLVETYKHNDMSEATMRQVKTENRRYYTAFETIIKELDGAIRSYLRDKTN